MAGPRSLADSDKFIIPLLYNSAILFLVIYPRKMETCPQKKTTTVKECS